MMGSAFFMLVLDDEEDIVRGTLDVCVDRVKKSGLGELEYKVIADDYDFIKYLKNTANKKPNIVLIDHQIEKKIKGFIFSKTVKVFTMDNSEFLIATKKLCPQDTLFIGLSGKLDASKVAGFLKTKLLHNFIEKGNSGKAADVIVDALKHYITFKSMEPID
jgi:hypothetical protein